MTHRQKAALLRPNGEVFLTFEQLEDAANGWADRIQHSPAEVVGLQLGNSPLWPAMLLAIWKLGRTVVPFDAEMTSARRSRLETMLGVQLRIGPGEEMIALPENHPTWGANRPPFWKITSGTTSEPRAVGFTADQLLADGDAICASMGLREEDRNYGVISLSHSYGFSNLITPLLTQGVSLVVAEDRMPRAILSGLALSEATVLPGVPALFRMLAEFDPLGKLRLCLSAGAPLTEEISTKFHQRWSRKIHSFYGSSECGGICYDATDEAVPAGWVGEPLRGVSLQRISEENPSLVQVSSAAVGLGYFPEPDPALKAGVFYPADLLEETSQGFFLRGRVSDLINVAGRKVAPEEIERVLREHPAVRDVVAFGVPATHRGEDIAVCLVAEATEDVLRLWLSEKVAGWQMPKRWLFLDEIPTNARGKVSRADLRSRLI